MIKNHLFIFRQRNIRYSIVCGRVLERLAWDKYKSSMLSDLCKIKISHDIIWELLVFKKRHQC